MKSFLFWRGKMFSKLKQLQGEVYKLLENSYLKNRLVHSYLFTGEPGTLKDEASKFLASLLLCENKNACGKCKECNKILNEKNENVFIITPDGQNIKKSQIIELEREFALTSNRTRVFIIKEIDKATPASANSLLKFLEETNENCYGVLITENLDNILPTIRSRSQVVYFKPINRDYIINYLREQNIEEDIAIALSILTNNIEKAIIFGGEETIYKIINFVKKIMIKIEENYNLIILLGTDGRFLFRESKEYHEYFLDLLITIQNDKIKKLLNNKNIIFKSFLYNLKVMLDIETQIKILEILMEFKKKIRYNLNMELAYYKMIIEIARCIDG